jgi:hypothetical protein
MMRAGSATATTTRVTTKTIVAICASITAALLIACGPPDFEGDDFGGKTKSGASTQSDNVECAAGSAPAAAAGPALTPEDPNKFPKCACAKGGKARCIPKDKVPSNVSAQLDTCTEGGAGVCVPDALVKSGGAAPPTCKSAFGEGRCMSMCVPEVSKNATLLNRGEGDTCAEDERCVPCKNPLKNNEPTGVCEIGKPVTQCAGKAADQKPSGPAAPLACPYTGPAIVDVKTFPACGDGARCVPENLVPANAAALLKKCSGGVCAPEKSIAAGGQYLPKTCKSIANAEGRCVNVNIPAVEAQKASLPQDNCDANERCTPCFSPLDGKETGACKTVTCDSPKQPAVQFKTCCQGKGTGGKCVPKTMVPAAQQSKLRDDEDACEKGTELCAPNENLDPANKPAQCTASTLFTGQYSGVCVSDCVDFSFIESIGTSRGNCPKSFTCAPCEQGGKPTGAPGCPGTANQMVQ